MPYLSYQQNFLYCPGNDLMSVAKNWPTFGNDIHVSYANLCNINPEVPGQGRVYDHEAAQQVVAKTIDDDGTKGTWTDWTQWHDGLNPGQWWSGNHPGMFYQVNPGVEPEGRWLARLNGSASWDHFTEPDSESRAMKRRVLLQASSSWYLSY